MIAASSTPRSNSRDSTPGRIGRTSLNSGEAQGAASRMSWAIVAARIGAGGNRPNDWRVPSRPSAVPDRSR